MSPSSGFEPLLEGTEPTAAELAGLVDEAYAATATSTGSMGESDPGEAAQPPLNGSLNSFGAAVVVFAGAGEPLLRTAALLETVALVRQRRNGIAFRIVTNGLFGAETVDQLVGSGLLALGDADGAPPTCTPQSPPRVCSR